MINTLETLAAAKTNPGIMDALGINWKLLALQGVAFLLLVWFLKKFVYPPLVKAIDDRQDAIEKTTQAAAEAEEHARKSEERINKVLKKARQEADEIVSIAQKEAVAVAAEIEEKAKKQAEYIASEAKEQIKQDVREAKKTLRQETTGLVALATEKVIKQKLNEKADRQLVEAAIKEAE